MCIDDDRSAIGLHVAIENKVKKIFRFLFLMFINEIYLIIFYQPSATHSSLEILFIFCDFQWNFMFYNFSRIF